MSLPRPVRPRAGARHRPAVRAAAPSTPAPEPASGAAVLRNRPFLLLWLAQLSTQVGGNMVLYGLEIVIFGTTGSYSAVAGMMLSFLVPAVIFSAVAGVVVDQVDKRHMLIVTNILRAIAYFALLFVGGNLALIYLLVLFVSTVTTFFGPAEASSIPFLVPRQQLIAANGLFTLTMNVAFAAGFALFGPLVVQISNANALFVLVAVSYLVAAAFCYTLPPSPAKQEEASPSAGRAVADAEDAVRTLFAELREGIAYIRDHHNVGWSLAYLGITASLIGVLGTIGPGFAVHTLGLAEKDFVVVVLPLGFGVVTGILALNTYGNLVPRRRLIEGGLIALGVLLAGLTVAGPVSQFLQGRATGTAGLVDISRILSLLSIVVGIAFVAGIAYALVAIPSQVQLQEDLPEDVRGRVFGVLNMLVSIASFLPIIVVGFISDLVGVTPVILFAAFVVGVVGVASVLTRGPLQLVERAAHTTGSATAPVDPMTAASVPHDWLAWEGARSPAVRAQAEVGARPHRRPTHPAAERASQTEASQAQTPGAEATQAEATRIEATDAPPATLPAQSSLPFAAPSGGGTQPGPDIEPEPETGPDAASGARPEGAPEASLGVVRAPRVSPDPSRSHAEPDASLLRGPAADHAVTDGAGAEDSPDPEQMANLVEPHSGAGDRGRPRGVRRVPFVADRPAGFVMRELRRLRNAYHGTGRGKEGR